MLSSNTEKQPAEEIRKAELNLEDRHSHIDEKRERALLRKIDLHLMVPLWIVFVFGFLDRINLGNVSILGILPELQMSGTDMTIAMQIFFVPYIISDIPSNIILKRFAPSTWISMLTFFWGMCCCTCHV
jgi:sugar phosphate permease